VIFLLTAVPCFLILGAILLAQRAYILKLLARNERLNAEFLEAGSRHFVTEISLRADLAAEVQKTADLERVAWRAVILAQQTLVLLNVENKEVPSADSN
jgi:hypothetical protein